MELGDAGSAEEEETGIADLSLDELTFREKFTAERTPLLVNIRRCLALTDDGFEAEQGNDDDKTEKDNGKDGDCHGRPGW
jgi:hypothetical protein